MGNGRDEESEPVVGYQANTMPASTVASKMCVFLA
jgi:hypothetical protein